MTPTRSELLHLLTAYTPTDADEQRYRMEMLDVAAVAHDPFSRDEYTPGHFTSSAFVVHPAGDQVLLVHHGKLGIWVQPGGHIEAGDFGILEAAMREAVEETGVTGLIPITEGLFDIDVHVFPEGSGQPRHLHMDLRFAFVAASGDLAGTDEVRDCRWVGLADLAALGVARSVHRPVGRLLGDRLPG